MQIRDFVALGAQAADLMARARIAIGVMLIAAGVLVAVFPEILVLLVASLIVSAGMGTLVSGWRAHRRLRTARSAQPRYRVHEHSA